MRKEVIGVISIIIGVIGIGLAILFLFLPYRVKNMTDLEINAGFTIAGLFIVSGILTAIFTLTSIGSRIMNRIKILRFRSPIFTDSGIDNTSSKRKATNGAVGEKIGQSASGSIPPLLAAQLQHPRDDAVYYLLISGRDFSSLAILRGVAGWPVQYPIKLCNTRPVPIELVGFTIRILLNGIPIQAVSWNKPDIFASNGASIGHPIYIQADSPTPFNMPVPVVLAQIQSILPEASPSWGAIGELRFQGDKVIMNRPFDFTNDNYTLSQADWDDLRKNAFPK